MTTSNNDITLTEFLSLTTNKAKWPKARSAFQNNPPFRQVQLPLPFQLYLDWDLSDSSQDSSSAVNGSNLKISSGVDYAKEALNLLKVEMHSPSSSESSPNIIQSLEYEKKLPPLSQDARESNNERSSSNKPVLFRVYRSNVTKAFKATKKDTIKQVIQMAVEKLQLVSGVLPENAKVEDFVLYLLGEDLFICDLNDTVGSIRQINDKLDAGERIISLQLLDKELAYHDTLKHIEFQSTGNETENAFAFQERMKDAGRFQVKIHDLVAHIKRHQVSSIDIKTFLRYHDTVLPSSVKHSKITSFDGNRTEFDEWIQLDVSLGVIPRETCVVFELNINDNLIEVATPVYNSLGALESGKKTLSVPKLFEKIKDIVYDREPSDESVLNIEFPDWDQKAVLFDSNEVSKRKSELISGQDLEKLEASLETVESSVPALLRLLKAQTSVYAAHVVQENLLKVLSEENGGSSSDSAVISSYDAVAVAVELLSWESTDVRIRSFAVTDVLHKLNDEQLTLTLYVLLHALRFELYHDSELMRFLLHRSLKNPSLIGQRTFWLSYHMYHHHSTSVDAANRYATLLRELSRNAPLSFMRDEIFPCILLSVQLVEALSQKTPEKRKDIVSNLYVPRTQLGFPLPVATSTRITQVSNVKILSNNRVLLTCTDQHNHTKINLQYARNVDERQEAFVIDLIRLMDMIWKQNGLNLRMLHLYDVCCLSENTSMMEREDLQVECASLLSLNVEKNPRAIIEYLEKKKANVDNFIHSVVGYILAIYILGISERTFDKMFVTESGHLFHTDFQNFLTSQQQDMEKALQTQKIFNIQLFNVLGGGELTSERANLFFSLAREAFVIARRQCKVFQSCLRMMIGCGIANLDNTEKALTWIDQTLMLQTHEEEEAQNDFEQAIRTALQEAGMMQVGFDYE